MRTSFLNSCLRSVVVILLTRELLLIGPEGRSHTKIERLRGNYCHSTRRLWLGPLCLSRYAYVFLPSLALIVLLQILLLSKRLRQMLHHRQGRLPKVPNPH